MAAPTEAEVQRAYALGEEQRVVRQLYYTDPAEAKAAYARLEGGRPFLDEAHDLYGTADSTAGSLGVVSYWELDDAFAEAAFSTPVGAYSMPVRTRLGTHIIQVEDRIRNPILTEDEYTRRRKGVESQLRLRTPAARGRCVRPRLYGGAQRGRQPPGPGRAGSGRSRTCKATRSPTRSRGGRTFTRSERSEVLESFRPETPLAPFTLDGQPQTFTVADYVFWLDALPSGEARNRTGASFGRALRNEALARAGEAAGVDEPPEVRHELARLQRLRLADALRASSAPRPSAPTPPGWRASRATSSSPPGGPSPTSGPSPFADRAPRSEAALPS